MTTSLQGWMRSKRNFFFGAALGLLIASTGNPPIAAEISGGSPEGAGLQTASWLITVPYGAVKAAYAVGGHRGWPHLGADWRKHGSCKGSLDLFYDG